MSKDLSPAEELCILGRVQRSSMRYSMLMEEREETALECISIERWTSPGLIVNRGRGLELEERDSRIVVRRE
jgi:hypothetical protein